MHDDLRIDATITDLALCIADGSKSFCFPGPAQIPPEFRDYCGALVQRCNEKRRERPEQDDFAVSHQDIVWRAHFDEQSIDGEWYRLRRMPRHAPHLGDGGLPSRLPPAITASLMQPELRSGGLVLVFGPTGAGKTTTASATVRSRLEAFAGMAYTVEDPPEHPLNGWHRGASGVLGYCAQTLVAADTDSVDGWSASMIGALRSQPAGTPSILFVGEIRNVRAAEVAIQAAGNGFLVIATGFATDIPSGLDALLKMLGHARAPALGALLRIVLYQRLLGDILQAQILVSPSPNSRVATAIAGGQLLRLSDEVQMQANLVRAGADLWKATGTTA
jgi:Tfp pilus assembly pilus retraction ATPase PilT